MTLLDGGATHALRKMWPVTVELAKGIFMLKHLGLWEAVGSGFGTKTRMKCAMITTARHGPGR